MNAAPAPAPATATATATARARLAALLAAVSLAGCGGGAGDTPAPPPPPSGVDNAARAAAATTTAQANASCQAIVPFYWEIGSQASTAGAPLASGSVGNKPDGTPWRHGDVLDIASASKLVFAAYVAEKVTDAATFTPLVPFLNFTSGYSNFADDQCTVTQTVSQCEGTSGINAAEAASATFHYNGGHMQELAAHHLGLGAMHGPALTAEVAGYVGSGFTYLLPQPAGGLRTTPDAYAAFLRRLLVDSPSPLRLGGMLADDAVCTQPSATCNAADASVAALPEDFHYGLGHWIEDDPAATPSSNYAYSSAGKFGFYPWVDVDRRLYGIVAREDLVSVGAGFASIQCGEKIRLAWKTGVAQ